MGITQCLRQATPTQAERAQLSEGISTGISALDVLAPIGRGQSLLICGSQGAGKTTLTSDIIERILSSGMCDKVIRFCIDPSAAPVAAPSHRTHAYSEFVAKLPNASSASCYLDTLFEAVAAAEAIRDSGRHAVLVIDTLAPMTAAWDLGVQWSQAELGEPLDAESVAGQRRSFLLICLNVLQT